MAIFQKTFDIETTRPINTFICKFVFNAKMTIVVRVLLFQYSKI